MQYAIPDEMERLRLSLNIVKPGTFWIDDLRITRESGEPVEPL